MKDDNKARMTPAAVAALAQGDIANFVAAATPGGIEAQEAQGQRDLVASTTLPKKGDRETLEAWGVQFGEDADDLFINVTLPPSWTKSGTSHSMWSDLRDERGRKRASIFYKAAFYDRSAHYHSEGFAQVSTRYLDAQGADFDWEKHDGQPAKKQTVVRDANGVIHWSGPLLDHGDYKSDEGYEEARQQQAALFPSLDDPCAYWND